MEQDIFSLNIINIYSTAWCHNPKKKFSIQQKYCQATISHVGYRIYELVYLKRPGEIDWPPWTFSVWVWLAHLDFCRPVDGSPFLQTPKCGFSRKHNVVMVTQPTIDSPLTDHNAKIT